METPWVPRGGCGCVNHPFGESEPPVTPGGVDLRLVPSWVNLELAQVTRESSKRGWRKGRIGADGSAAQLSAQGVQCTGRYLGRPRGPGPLTATSWGSALASELRLFICPLRRADRGRHMAGGRSEGQVDSAFPERQSGHFFQEGNKNTSQCISWLRPHKYLWFKIYLLYFSFAFAVFCYPRV